MSIISEGYRIPFIGGHLPPISDLPNNASALKNASFIEEQLFQYESLGFIKYVSEKSRVILPLSAVFSNRWRLVVDGSQNLNQYIKNRKVKLSHLSVANQNLVMGQWFATADLESGYHQIPVHPDFHNTLGIKWTKNGKIVYFQ